MGDPDAEAPRTGSMAGSIDSVQRRPVLYPGNCILQPGEVMLKVIPDDEQQNIRWYGRFEKTDCEISARRSSSMDNVKQNRELDTGRPSGSRGIITELQRLVGELQGPDETVSEVRQWEIAFDELPEES